MHIAPYVRKFVLVLLPVMLLAIIFASTPLVFGQNKNRSPRLLHVAPLTKTAQIGSSNPVAFGEPIIFPTMHPATVTILQNQSFGNAPAPVQSQVSLPAGHWQKAILTITGTQQGRQFDRLLFIWAANTQIFTGVTPEPTQAGIAWTVHKDVTSYLPLFSGTQTFTTWINNYVTSVYTGIPVITVTLSLYPRSNEPASSASAWNQNAPDSIVSLTPSPTTVTVHPQQSLTATLTLPDDVSGAFLDLYAIAQINDEFWWASTPAFRELEVSIDGKPAGLVWPFPFVYTGGVNPYLWRPISAINTLNMPSYRLDLTPFAGLLGGQHTLTITVLNNQDYWLLSGSLLLTEDHGHPTSGTIIKNTLTPPTQAQSTTTPLIADTSTTGNSQTDVTASQQYEIQGTIHTHHGTVTATVTSSLSFSNDQVLTNPDNWEVVHGYQDVTTDERLAGTGGTHTFHSDEMYTIDSASAFIQTSQSQNAFLLPANVSQTLHRVEQVTGPDQVKEQRTLNLNLESFANLQAGDPAANIPQVVMGSTTATGDFETSSGLFYHLALAARAGTLTLDQREANFTSDGS